MEQNKEEKQQIKVSYTETSALYASQFIINTSEEDVTINFSSGPMSDPAGETTVLPIHTRIAMGKEGAKRLHAVLGRVLSQSADGEKVPKISQAQLPKMDS